MIGILARLAMMLRFLSRLSFTTMTWIAERLLYTLNLALFAFRIIKEKPTLDKNNTAKPEGAAPDNEQGGGEQKSEHKSEDSEEIGLNHDASERSDGSGGESQRSDQDHAPSSDDEKKDSDESGREE